MEDLGLVYPCRSIRHPATICSDNDCCDDRLNLGPMPVRTTTRAVVESFFATLKRELLYRRVWTTRAAAQRAIAE